MKKENFKKFQKLIKEIENSQGYRIDSVAYDLENSFIAAVVNFGELEKILENVPVFNVEQKRECQSRRFMLNVLRVFSNYLASVTAFRDHTRNFIKDIYGSTQNAFEGKYQEKINNDFKNNSLAQFIEDIRNFHQHYRPLPISILTRVENDKLYSRVVLSRDLLLKSNYKWGKGKSFLSEANKNGPVDVLEIAESYLYKTIFPWMMKQQAKYHKKEFNELQNLKNVARKLYNSNEN